MLLEAVCHLGPRNGWRYWRLSRQCARNPGLAPALVAAMRAHAEHVNDPAEKSAWEGFAADIEASHAAYFFHATHHHQH